MKSYFCESPTCCPTEYGNHRLRHPAVSKNRIPISVTSIPPLGRKPKNTVFLRGFNASDVPSSATVGGEFSPRRTKRISNCRYLIFTSGNTAPRATTTSPTASPTATVFMNAISAFQHRIRIRLLAKKGYVWVRITKADRRAHPNGECSDSYLFPTLVSAYFNIDRSEILFATMRIPGSKRKLAR